MPRWKVDIPTLQLALEVVQRYRKTSAREVADEIGVPPSTLTRLKDGHKLDVDAFASVLEWLNMSHKRFVQRADGVPAGADDEMVTVSRRDVLMAWSWAREALASLAEGRIPEGSRNKIEESLQRLIEEVGPHLLETSSSSSAWGAPAPQAPQPQSSVDG